MSTAFVLLHGPRGMEEYSWCIIVVFLQGPRGMEEYSWFIIVILVHGCRGMEKYSCVSLYHRTTAGILNSEHSIS
jgi:hypothetical protein